MKEKAEHNRMTRDDYNRTYSIKLSELLKTTEEQAWEDNLNNGISRLTAEVTLKVVSHE